MSDISLLPEGLRGKEQAEVKHKPAPISEPGNLKMHIPESSVDEDIEIIEVDESDLGAILADEPLFTRLSYQLSAAVDALKQKLTAGGEAAPPPKLPPQFFTPPKPGLVTKAQALPPGAAKVSPVVAGAKPIVGAPVPAGTAGVAAKPRARITPQAVTPRRVRIIRRVRKPVRVSLITAEDTLIYRVDVSKRKWTLAVCSLLFVAILGGGYALLSARVADAKSSLASVGAEVDATRTDIALKQDQWKKYADLQQRLVLLDDLLKNHVVISRLFDFLERRTLPEVAYRSASLSPDGTLTLDVLADSFNSAARQLVALEQSAIVKKADATSFAAQIDGVTGLVQGVTFQLIIKLDTAQLRGPLPESVNAVPATSSTQP